MTRWMIGILLVTVSLWAAGCAGPAPPTTYHRINPAAKIEGGPKTGLTLAVKPFKASEPLSRSNIVYRLSQGSMQHYQYDLWESAPPEAVTGHLVDALRAGGAFKSVSKTRLDALVDLALKGRVVKFERTEAGSPWMVEVALEAELTATREKKVILTTTAEASAQAPTPDKQGLALAAGQALSRCLEKVVADVTESARVYQKVK